MSDVEKPDTGVEEQTEPVEQETDWKAIARRWERRSKQNWSDLTDARAEIESLKAVVSENENLSTLKADYEALRQQHEAMLAAAKAGVDWEVLGDSKTFNDKLAGCEDIPALVQEFAEQARFKPAAPSAVAQKATVDDPAQSALAILLGKE